MKKALQNLLDRYTGLVNSGDAGSWDPETEQEVIDARTALKKRNRRIIVHVRGGVAYCDDPRVNIIDHDNDRR